MHDDKRIGSARLHLWDEREEINVNEKINIKKIILGEQAINL